ncbi:hypothetical protein P3339_08120 [Microbulbifer sp. MLAF003]|uniref:hypothetical protein n=1 Tax=unclassified Microbulbifer TaxID=2619833 RepID=UPI0024AC95D9|nr:hypothetical protein [Microbulbifer sp. MLAF003]WHI52714.1 hypothetical protein P3339_08120 [Microbulbifer sp. MLAF003]
MSDFYNRMADTALRLIARFGSEQILHDIIPGVSDPVTGQSSGDTPINQPVQVILQDYNLKESGLMYAEGQSIQQGDKKLIIAAAGLKWAPTLTTEAEINGVKWQVVNIKEANPAGTPLVYFCQVRK